MCVIVCIQCYDQWVNTHLDITTEHVFKFT